MYLISSKGNFSSFGTTATYAGFNGIAFTVRTVEGMYYTIGSGHLSHTVSDECRLHIGEKMKLKQGAPKPARCAVTSVQSRRDI